MTHYIVCANDGCEVSQELPTLKQARKELRDIIQEDKKEFGLDEGDIDYYILKVTEQNGKIYEEEVR